MNEKTTINLIEESAPVDWDNIFSNLSAEQRGKVARELEGIALKAAELAAYAEERYGYGCGDQGHDAAVKASRWMLAVGVFLTLVRRKRLRGFARH